MENNNHKYQLFPPLSTSEYDELEASIIMHGVLHAIVVDEDGEILDGHTRNAICLNRNIQAVPRKVMSFKSEEEKKLFVIQMNIGRRHLTKDQREGFINQMRALGKSIKSIAADMNVSVGTVHATVTKEEARRAEAGEPPLVSTVTDKNGKVHEPAMKDEGKENVKKAAAERNAKKKDTPTATTPPVATVGGFTVHEAASNSASLGDTASKVTVVHPPLGTIDTLSSNIIATYSREQIDHLVTLLSNHLVATYTPEEEVEEIEGGEVTETDVIPAEDSPQT